MGPLSEDRRRKKTRSSLSRRSRIPVVSAQTMELTVPAAEDSKEALTLKGKRRMRGDEIRR
jgi:hypothetical protein